MRRKVLLLVPLLLTGGVVWKLVTLPSPSELQRLRSEIPASSALMRLRYKEAREADRPWRPDHQRVPLEKIAPCAQNALLASEDARFFEHDGFDRTEIENALEARLDGRRLRGASTLTQQLAKNLYLNPSRSPLRKLEEAWLTWRLERTLSKNRILELYLNEVEWGDGIFGIESAARSYFGKSAQGLSPSESALLIAMLPNPRWISPSHPRRLQQRALHVLARLRSEGLLSPEKTAQAKSELVPNIARMKKGPGGKLPDPRLKTSQTD